MDCKCCARGYWPSLMEWCVNFRRCCPNPQVVMTRKNVRLPGEVHARQTVDTGDESFVQQSLANETDINVIMRRFGATGGLPQINAEGFYGDFTGIGDYESAAMRVEQARAHFMQLPAETRERFGNDPAYLLDYAQGKDPDELAKDLGFVIPKPLGVASVPAPSGDGGSAAPSGGNESV